MTISPCSKAALVHKKKIIIVNCYIARNFNLLCNLYSIIYAPLMDALAVLKTYWLSCKVKSFNMQLKCNALSALPGAP